MLSTGQRIDQSRMKAAAGVIALHALIGYAFISGLAYEVTREVTENIQVFDVTEPPPPPEETIEPAPTKAPEPEGAAAPESMDAVVVPEPEVWLAITPKIQTAQAKGTSDVPGRGTGSGGEGTGTGSGGQGTGTGGGGGTGAQRIRGALAYADLPRSARERRAQGNVGVRFTVQPNGRVTECAVTRSSGDSDLDRTTCRMIERRFRYRPALDARGNPIAETVTTAFEWVPTFG